MKGNCHWPPPIKGLESVAKVEENVRGPQNADIQTLADLKLRHGTGSSTPT